ncbi:ATP-binding protein [Anaerospora sp.]|uniref:sensor histidine kinase n=3 Tax=Anaerospora sp. TaxID=1960278 RepID=UPI002898FC68|nr:ATP-binding protein [Anaerospora sp.]
MILKSKDGERQWGLGSILLLFLLCTIGLISMTLEGVQQQCVDKNVAILHHGSDRVNSYFSRIQGVLLAAADPVQPTGVESGTLERIQKLGIDYPEISSISIVDKQGNVVYSSYHQQMNYPLSSEKYFQKALKSSKPGISDLYTKLGNRAVAVYVPLMKEGEVVGLIQAIVDPYKLNNLLSDLIIGREHTFLGITDTNGVIIAFSHPQYIGTSLTRLESIQLALQGQHAAIAETSALGKDWRLVVARPLADNQGAVVLSQPTRAVYSPVTALLQYEIPAVLLWIILIGVLIYRKVLRISQQEVDLMALQAEKANAVAEIAASVAHEVRNPLTGIRGFMQLLSSRTKDPKAHEYGKLIVEEVDRVEVIISEFLSLAKPHSMRRTKCSLTGILRSVYLLASGRGIYNGVDIEFIETESIGMMADGAQLKQAFLNLCTNSIQAMPNGGKLTISVKREAGQAFVLIQDTGEGIRPEHIPRLGERFFTTKEDGSGLGLAVVYRVIEDNHRGKIDVRSELNIGTTFCIWLPLE